MGPTHVLAGVTLGAEIVIVPGEQSCCGRLASWWRERQPLTSLVNPVRIESSEDQDKDLELESVLNREPGIKPRSQFFSSSRY